MTLKIGVRLKVLQTKLKIWIHFVTISVYKNCADVYKFGKQISGVYKIDPDGLGEYEVFCDHKTAGGGWTVFQKRQDGSVHFFRGWADYKRGFGNLNGAFWLGLDKINRLTVSSSNKLRVDLEDLQDKTAFAEYSSFAVTSERAKYQLSLGSYSGKLKRDSIRLNFVMQERNEKVLTLLFSLQSQFLGGYFVPLNYLLTWNFSPELKM